MAAQLDDKCCSVFGSQGVFGPGYAKLAGLKPTGLMLVSRDD